MEVINDELLGLIENTYKSDYSKDNEINKQVRR